MEIKLDPERHGKNYPLADDGKIKPDWLALFEDFSDRFIIGSDQHYPRPKGPNQRWQTVVLLFNQLPGDLRRTIGIVERASHLCWKIVCQSRECVAEIRVTLSACDTCGTLHRPGDWLT